MKVTHLNRGLGIIYLFVKNNFNHISNWLIPATICFSVPLLFLKLKKRITFYDFGFNPDLILERVPKNEKVGILIFDYYGKKWEESCIAYLKNYFDCIIHDCCLSYPETVIENISAKHADLVVFSTGPKKTVDIGYGALGYYKSCYDMRTETISYSEEWKKNYCKLEQNWKKSLNNHSVFSNFKCVASDWIDISSSKIEDDYVDEVKKKNRQVKKIKTKINSIYEEIIPDELKLKGLSNDWRYNITIDHPEVILNEFRQHNLFASTHYANTAQILGYGNEELNKSLFVEKHIINLFNDFYYDTNMAEISARIIKELYKKSKIKPVLLEVR